MNNKFKYILVLLFVPTVTFAHPFKIDFKSNKKKELKPDTIIIRDTVFIENITTPIKAARVIYYPEETLAAFDEDIDSLFTDWRNSMIDPEDTDHNPTGYPEYSDSVYQQRLLDMSQDMVIEMPFNSIVRNYIKVYTERGRKSSAEILGKLDYYMPIFETELDKAGLPMELRCVPIIESALRPRAYSRAGASGLWQFVYSTGKMYHLDVNSYVDERRDPIKATQQAVKYFEDLYAIYKDWFLVIAAYNCGPGNVNKAIRRSGGKRDYWAIYYYLPRETRGYVPAFIAANYLLNYSSEHNIQPTPSYMPMFTDTVNVNKPLNLNQVSEVMGINIDLLRELNPQYRLDIIPGSEKKQYTMILPGTSSADYVVMKDSVMAYKRDELIDKKRATVQPGSHSYARGVAPKGKTALIYKVKTGDNLGYIADWYDVRVSDLRYWNNIHRNLIRVNQKLVVYVPSSKVNKYKHISENTRAQKTTVASATTTAIELDAKYEYYQVRNGDNLWIIARQYPGISAENIKALNGMNNNKIKPGQYLKIRKIG